MQLPIQKIRELVSHYFKLAPSPPPDSEPLRRLGLNIGRANIVASEISSSNNELTLEKCARKPILPDQPIVEQLKSFLNQAGFHSKRVGVSVKGQGVVIRFLSFPKMSRTDFASSIRYEAEKYLPFSLSEVIFDYHILNEGALTSESQTNMSVILVAVRKTEIERLIQTVQMAGLKPDLVDVDTFACSNAFEHANPEINTKSVSFIDLGAADSSFGILDKGSLVFSRDIAFGGNDLTEMIHRKLNISIEDAKKIQMELQPDQKENVTIATEGLNRLFQEIKSSVTYYFNQNQSAPPLEGVYISGGLSHLGILPKLLEQQLGFPVHFWNPVNQLNISPEIDQDDLSELNPYLPVSIGLAIRPIR